MSSWKLTIEARQRLRKAILKHRFASIGVTLADQHASLAVKCFEKAFSKSERAQMEALPDGWLPKSCDIKVQFAGKVDRLDFSGCPAYGDLPYSPARDRAWRLLPTRNLNGVVLVVEATERLGVLHAKLRQDVDRANEDLKNLSRQVDAVLAQASTSGRLIELWPEAEPFLAEMNKAPSRSVPAVPIGALNKMLGLPVGKAAVA